MRLGGVSVPCQGHSTNLISWWQWVSPTCISDLWWISGCVSPNKVDWGFKEEVQVKGFDGKPEMAVGSGSITLTDHRGNRQTLNDVVYVPEIYNSTSLNFRSFTARDSGRCSDPFTFLIDSRKETELLLAINNVHLRFVTGSTELPVFSRQKLHLWIICGTTLANHRCPTLFCIATGCASLFYSRSSRRHIPVSASSTRTSHP